MSYRKIVVVGIGQMGHSYLPILIKDCKVDPASIQMVDLKPEAMQFSPKEIEKAAGLAAMPPGMTDLAAALEGGAGMLFNLTNSPMHLSVFDAAVNAGVRHVFSEKPVVPANHLDFFEKMPKGDTVITVGHLINFSGAVQELLKQADELDLKVILCQVEWGKPRWGIVPKPSGANARPTAGVVDDELCHGLKLFELLVRHTTATVGRMSVRADVFRIPFANEAVQTKAKEIDSSFSLLPPSTVQLRATLRADGRDSELLLRSSFVRPSQSREVCFVFSAGDSLQPAYQARLTFDVNEQDTLEFGAIGEAPTVFQFGKDKDKICAMMRSYLDFTSGAKRDERLTTMELAVQDVRFAQAVMESVRLDGSTVQVEESEE